jgi:malate synthase
MWDLEINGPVVDYLDEVLTPPALGFLAELHDHFADRRNELVARRRDRRNSVASTGGLDFLPGTAAIRAADWSVAPAPADLLDRRVEITGPTDPKMAINAMNSGANVWLADLEDANTPHWRNVIGGQAVLMAATRRTLEFESDGKHYSLNAEDTLATVVFRPRGWHLDEMHLTQAGVPAIGALVDFGLYFFHNAAELIARGSGPYFYLPKLESHLEARLWNDVFLFAQNRLGIPAGTIRATVLIETIPAAFEMDEILYELRNHASGLNAGRWDYLFSFIKYFRDAGPAFVLPDRNSIGMTAPFMRSYAKLLQRTCHRRKAFAIGGMAAFIPSRRDSAVNETALAKVREDKEREAGDGFDGSWVAHPDLVPLCREVFTARLGTRPNQLDFTPEPEDVTAADLLNVATAVGRVTEAGLRNDVSVGVQYLASWLDGVGAVAINNLMEDAATAEIARSQVWQWYHSGTPLDDGRTVTRALVLELLRDEVARLEDSYPGDRAVRLTTAASLFETVSLADDYVDFLTIPAYRVLLERETETPEGVPAKL